MKSIPILLEANLLADGIRHSIGWNIESHPHALIVGGTGSGKTYALKLILGKIGMYIPNAQITLCDYKNSDFAMFKGAPHHYGYQDCIKGLQVFYDTFQARLDGVDISASPQILAFDEWGAFIISQDKKQADVLKSRMSELLMLGRSYETHIIIGLQRADSEHFKSGARDQFSQILALGNLSKEQKQMLFSDYKDEMSATNRRGQGYLLQDGKPLRRIIVPKVSNMSNLENTIKRAVTHKPPVGA